MDRTWLKNLAASAYAGGAWQHPDANHPGFVAHSRLIESMEQLYATIHEAINIFNLYAPAHKQLKLYRLSRSGGSSPYGLTIMLQRLQVNVEEKGGHFRVTATLHNGPTPPTIVVRMWTPKADPFGAVQWLKEDGIPMDLSAISKLILEDTCRLAYESGVISSP